MNSVKIWALFRKFRLFIFGTHAVLSLGWTIFLSFFLSREWLEYNISERAIMLGLTGFQGFIVLFIYLMMVVQFRKWLDAARVTFLLVFEASTITLYSIFSADFPCFQFGATVDTCLLAMKVIMIGIWSQSALLFLYICVLSVMTCLPEEPKPKSLEAKVAPIDSKTPSSRWSSSSSIHSTSGLLRPERERSRTASPSSLQPKYQSSVTPPPAYGNLQGPQPSHYGSFSSHKPATPSTASYSSVSTTSSSGSQRSVYGISQTIASGAPSQSVRR
ncbi:hypothetical protein ONZ45_g18474 [Pleurotus djamor]|nr:hypothetical protein ONZ45_g18474 [Pleurotus djamor]